MAKRALLVGCNYPGTKVELHGCANDVKRMHATLTSRFGFDESDVLVLLDTDQSGMQPTGQNIRSCLGKLIAGTEPGDILVFHYSGHGTQVPQEAGGPADETGAEEAIVPTDMNLLTDDDFRELVNQIPGGATFTFISDSCHSGGLIDAEKEQIGDSSGGGTGLMGLVSQGLGLQSRDFHFPGGGRRRNEDEEGYEGGRGEGYGEEGYEGEGRRRGRGEEGYGGEEQYGEDEEGYERRGRRREGYEEEEGYGRRRGEEEGYGRRREEEFGGYGGGEAEEFSEELGGRRGRRRGGEEEYEGYGRGSEEEQYAEGFGGGRRRGGEEGYEGYGGRSEEEQYTDELGGGYGGGGYGRSAQRVKSKEIPVDMLTQILSERTGHQVDIGNIRTTLFDMFGDQASPTVKMFANLVLQQLQGGDQGGWMGTVSSLATQFLQGKIDSQDSDQAASYLAPAQNAGDYRPRPQRRSQRAVDVGILLSGCQSNETSADASPSHNPAESYGAFSNAIQTVLSQTDGPISNRDLILQVRKVLQSQGFKQHPCLYSSDENADGPFICN
ncbi:hypothetical protein M758_9G178800 [Ceratodon purpureus]|nr:hypothetical protein M758_9G178800 [Ceratodon purpureus]